MYTEGLRNRTSSHASSPSPQTSIPNSQHISTTLAPARVPLAELPVNTIQNIENVAQAAFFGSRFSRMGL